MEWVFGYGSLIWNPGFVHAQACWGALQGWHRAACRYSFHARGCHGCPGLMVGLQPGGICQGMAYGVLPKYHDRAFAYLDKREGHGRAYFRQKLPVMLAPQCPDAESITVQAWAYVDNPEHEGYVGEMTVETIAQLIAQGVGKYGSSYDYVAQLLERLQHQGVAEPKLELAFRLATTLRQQPVVPVPYSKNNPQTVPPKEEKSE